MSLKLPGPILILGAGKMGGALLAGLLDKGLSPADVLIQDPAPPPEAAKLIAERGIRRAARFDELKTPPSVILAAVKPQIMDQVFASAAHHAGPDTLTLSIAAGRTIASFAAHLPAAAAIVRAMPNTPAAIGHGMTVCCANDAATAAHKELATALMSAVGKVAWVTDEALMDAVTAVSGSGPAYVFHLVECMTEAGIAAGLQPALAAELARSTVSGSGALLDATDLPAGDLRKNVTSPGGTTAAALEVLMAGDAMQDLFKRAIAAARDRGQQLSGG
ncbi:MAG: pyrroline-5-carboxylate reductase [Alphaproteobacteria bacterium]|nr:pyrroline-5-carboxylate reductase [Alphaproteobacteria bacterium]